MKKLTLLSLVFIAAASYGQAAPYIKDMMPRNRQALALAMIESADAYEQAGNKKRAAEYRKGALAVFPIGDKAHALARTLKTTLDDEATYKSFVASADVSLKAKNYRRAMAEYLMALELRQPIEVYEKLQKTYLMLGDKENAASLQTSIDQVKMNPQKDGADLEEAAYQEEIMQYQAEAEEAYPQEYPIDGYGEEEALDEGMPADAAEEEAPTIINLPAAEPGMEEEVMND